jgi:hypothetical protein
MSYQKLIPERIIETIERLEQRIAERFPQSSLRQMGSELLDIAKQAAERSAQFARPILPVRIATWIMILLIGVFLLTALLAVKTPDKPLDLIQFAQAVESSINDFLLIGAAIFFLVSLETRMKRRRALRALDELRAIAHIIDMHQLPKDPEWSFASGKPTAASRPQEMSRFELSRYLDYCTEMLSLTGKIAALYVQNFDDAVALAAANEIEILTTSLSRKIWQKIKILQNPHQ